MKKRLLYRVLPRNGGVVFAAPARARLIARIHAALDSAQTWGEFESAMPPDSYLEIVRGAFGKWGQPRPDGTEPFSPELVPGWAYGDYPPWLQREMHDVLPAPVLEMYGQRKSTFMNGNFWYISEENLVDVCAVLEAPGWELERTQDLEFH